MDVSTANIARVPLQDLLCFVLTFKSGFEKLTFACKSLILIDDSLVDRGQISLEIHKYESDSKVALPPHNKTVASSPLVISPPSGRTCVVFINVTTKNKAMYK